MKIYTLKLTKTYIYQVSIDYFTRRIIIHANNNELVNEVLDTSNTMLDTSKTMYEVLKFIIDSIIEKCSELNKPIDKNFSISADNMLDDIASWYAIQIISYDFFFLNSFTNLALIA